MIGTLFSKFLYHKKKYEHQSFFSLVCGLDSNKFIVYIKIIIYEHHIVFQAKCKILAANKLKFSEKKKSSRIGNVVLMFNAHWRSCHDWLRPECILCCCILNSFHYNKCGWLQVSSFRTQTHTVNCGRLLCFILFSWYFFFSLLLLNSICNYIFSVL